ncbi:hypothetical protein OB955_25555 [Halobacteria archaeon AArc-m2/3/4]|uniref:Mandelate racemase/muconate lactonizing enzyme N-terminal domain-containing protein n=1 Tax=Natronoglomus mannanivorans TaxID=2979990 RepID=A0AAP2Z3Y9_9EURY|nr:hypothetical protein [Halobacteria archaeon AArc-xg1-1]MCU4976038.1 hypothetical protein [Halobacteria archaeon AArc-m2/3/4]
MEITAVETTPLRVPIGRTVGDSRLSITDVYWIVVELETDEGYTGTGWMGSLGFGPDLLSRFVDSQFREHLLGRNPFALEEIVRDLRRQTIYYGELGMSAWPRSAIDVALWDIQAQAAGQPLYRLLGGETGRVRAYASSMDATHEIDELAGLHGKIVEYIPEYDIAPLLENPPTIEDGEVVLPDRPGHGYRIDPAAKDEYGVSFD